MIKRQAVITGMGLLTPLGRNVEENWQGVKSGRTGIGHYPEDRLPAAFQYIGKVGAFDTPAVSASVGAQMKFLNRGSRLGFAAASEAVAQSGLRLEEISPARRALYVGSGDFTNSGHEFLHPALCKSTEESNHTIDAEKLNAAALTDVSPFFLLESMANNLFSFLSAAFELRGPNTSLSSLSPYGAQALELAVRSVEQGRADVALAVGYGSWITEVPLYELEGLGLLSKCHSGARSFKPFDRGRDGFIPGEGGAAVFLEAEEIAERRGGAILGRVIGAGSCIEVSSGLKVPAKVAVRSIRSAFEAAGCRLGDLAFFCAHGSATQKGDRSELSSFMEVLAAERARIPVCGLKPYTGHMGAASDLAEIVLGIKGIEHGLAPATPNFQASERFFSDLKISGQHQPCAGGSFLSLSYGLCGQSSALVVCAR